MNLKSNTLAEKIFKQSILAVSGKNLRPLSWKPIRILFLSRTSSAITLLPSCRSNSRLGHISFLLPLLQVPV